MDSTKKAADDLQGAIGDARKVLQIGDARKRIARRLADQSGVGQRSARVNW